MYCWQQNYYSLLFKQILYICSFPGPFNIQTTLSMLLQSQIYQLPTYKITIMIIEID